MRTQIQHSEVEQVASTGRALTALPTNIGRRNSRKPVYKPIIDRILADADAGHEATVFGPFESAEDVERVRSGVYAFVRKNTELGGFSFAVRTHEDGHYLYGWLNDEGVGDDGDA